MILSASRKMLRGEVLSLSCYQSFSVGTSVFAARHQQRPLHDYSHPRIRNKLVNKQKN
jgi:hypothetical protein